MSIIAESLTVNGLYRPIVTTKDGTILAGNHTYLAAESLGWSDESLVELLESLGDDLTGTGYDEHYADVRDNPYRAER